MNSPSHSLLDNVSSPILVYNQSTFAQMMSHLRQQPLFALDTESDSLFSYYPKVCLIQISAYAHAPNPAACTVGRPACHANPSPPDAVPRAHTNGTEKSPNMMPEVVDYIVDPLRFDTMGELGALLGNPHVEVIMHAASNDILTLQRNYDFVFNRIFDTQLAARILGWQRIGLAAILEEKFGVISDKRMQRTNWGRRPLTPQQLSYAQMDTHYLLALRHMLIEELHDQSRMEEACEAFQLLADVDYQDKPAQQRSVWQMKAARTIPHKSLGILAALWEWREGEAQQQNRPPFKIVTDQALVHIAKKRPRSLHDLRKIRGLGNTQVGRYGKDIVRVMREGQKRPPPVLPSSRDRSSSMPEKLVLDRYDALRQWRTHKANNRGVDPDIVFSNDTLLSIAKRAPTSESALREIPEIGPWKARTYGPDVLAILAEHGD